MKRMGESRFTYTVTICCDGHGSKRVPVANLTPVGQRWDESYRSASEQYTESEARSLGAMLVGDDPLRDQPGAVVMHDEPPGSRGVRERFEFRCRKCGKSVQVREEKLFSILNVLRENGIHDMTLRALNAILSKVHRTR